MIALVVALAALVALVGGAALMSYVQDDRYYGRLEASMAQVAAGQSERFQAHAQRREEIEADAGYRADPIARAYALRVTTLVTFSGDIEAMIAATAAMDPPRRWRSAELRRRSADQQLLVALAAEIAEGKRALEVLRSAPGDVGLLRADGEHARLEQIADGEWAKVDGAPAPSAPYSFHTDLRDGYTVAGLTFASERLDLDEIVRTVTGSSSSG
jgi:hypothetical protein